MCQWNTSWATCSQSYAAAFFSFSTNRSSCVGFFFEFRYKCSKRASKHYNGSGHLWEDRNASHSNGGNVALNLIYHHFKLVCFFFRPKSLHNWSNRKNIITMKTVMEHSTFDKCFSSIAGIQLICDSSATCLSPFDAVWRRGNFASWNESGKTCIANIAGKCWIVRRFGWG